MTKINIVLFIALFNLIACGGGDSSKTTEPVPVIVPDTTNYVPNDFTAFGISLIINNHVLNFSDVPDYQNEIAFDFESNSLLSLKSDLYHEADLKADYSVNETIENSVVISFTAQSSLNQYQLSLDFSSDNEGLWVLNDSNDEELLSGEFYYSNNESPANFSYTGRIETKRTINSTITDVSYPYRVYLPEGYYSNNQNYPVVYVTDGQWVFWEFSEFLDETNRQVILVSIEQGPNDRRQIDYRLPGSTDYVNFFKTEFMSDIESKYRVDINNRIIQGASYGGLVVSHFLMDFANQPSFNHYISSDGAYWFNSSTYSTLEIESFASWSATNSINLFLTGSSNGGNGGSCNQLL